ncbi:MAG: helix-turn-helix transcriptional regulator [Candidatus Bathyarchaeia archaeon]
MSSERLIHSLLGETRRLLIANLLGKEVNAIELARKLGINESAVRRHLDALEREGLVSSKFERRERGRPKKMFSLTADGRAMFPRKSRALFSLLIQAITRRYGEEEVSSLMSVVAKNFAEKLITKEVRGDLENRLKQLVQLLDDYGFFTSLSKRGDKYVIEYRNCVFEDIIPQFGKYICKIDEEVTRKVAGEVDIEWKERIAEGDKRCLQIISPSGLRDCPNSGRVTHIYEFSSPNTLLTRRLQPVRGGE